MNHKYRKTTSIESIENANSFDVSTRCICWCQNEYHLNQQQTPAFFSSFAQRKLKCVCVCVDVPVHVRQRVNVSVFGVFVYDWTANLWGRPGKIATFSISNINKKKSSRVNDRALKTVRRCADLWMCVCVKANAEANDWIVAWLIYIFRLTIKTDKSWIVHFCYRSTSVHRIRELILNKNGNKNEIHIK